MEVFKTLEEYLAGMALAGAYGGEPEMRALEEVLDREIVVYVDEAFTHTGQLEPAARTSAPRAELEAAGRRPLRIIHVNSNHFMALLPEGGAGATLDDNAEGESGIIMAARVAAMQPAGQDAVEAEEDGSGGIEEVAGVMADAEVAAGAAQAAEEDVEGKEDEALAAWPQGRKRARGRQKQPRRPKRRVSRRLSGASEGPRRSARQQAASALLAAAQRLSGDAQPSPQRRGSAAAGKRAREHSSGSQLASSAVPAAALPSRARSGKRRRQRSVVAQLAAEAADFASSRPAGRLRSGRSRVAR